MKKILLTILLLSAFAIGRCEPGHLTFWGIPVNGTITKFTAAMNRKGWKVTPESKTMPVGQRWFEDSSGKTPGIFVVANYAPDSKTVYAVTIFHEIADAKIARQLFNVQAMMLKADYVEDREDCTGIMESAEGEPPLLGVYVNDNDCNPLGTITVRLERNPLTAGSYMLFMEYTDHANYSRFLGR